MRKIGIWTLGVPAILVGLTVPPSHAADQPRINGGFWQPNAGMVEGFTDEALAQEVEHTGKAQRWMSRACERFGKTFWVDVENADMAETFKPFTMDGLESSLRVAAGHADTIVVFDYLHYMSKNSPKPEARKLHEDYRAYRSRSGARLTDEPLLPPDWDPVRAGREVMDRLIEVMPPPIKGAHSTARMKTVSGFTSPPARTSMQPKRTV